MSTTGKVLLAGAGIIGAGVVAGIIGHVIKNSNVFSFILCNVLYVKI